MTNVPIHVLEEPYFVHDAVIIAFWNAKKNTNEIAKLIKRHESIVANRLARLRDAGAL